MICFPPVGPVHFRAAKSGLTIYKGWGAVENKMKSEIIAKFWQENFPDRLSEGTKTSMLRWTTTLGLKALLGEKFHAAQCPLYYWIV
jgi:hypothetical protein